MQIKRTHMKSSDNRQVIENYQSCSPHEDLNSANQKMGDLAGSWMKATPLFIVILIDLGLYKHANYRWIGAIIGTIISAIIGTIISAIIRSIISQL